MNDPGKRKTGPGRHRKSAPSIVDLWGLKPTDEAPLTADASEPVEAPDEHPFDAIVRNDPEYWSWKAELAAEERRENRMLLKLAAIVVVVVILGYTLARNTPWGCELTGGEWVDPPPPSQASGACVRV